MTPEQKNLITRIKEMENRYHEVRRAIGYLDKAIENYNDIKDKLNILREYMESGAWLKDYEADEAGQVPQNLKREVISQDSLYNLLEEADKIIAFAKSSLR